MRIEIVQITDRGIANQERLHLRAQVDATLNHYAIFVSNYISKDAISTIPQHSFWFPPMQVNAGDNIILYTGFGTQTSTRNLDGTTNYFFYWGLKNTVWNRPEDCSVLLEIESWQTSPFK